MLPGGELLYLNGHGMSDLRFDHGDIQIRSQTDQQCPAASSAHAAQNFGGSVSNTDRIFFNKMSPKRGLTDTPLPPSPQYVLHIIGPIFRDTILVLA
jgi:hypothetical protein